MTKEDIRQELVRREHVMDRAGLARCDWVATHSDLAAASDSGARVRMLMVLDEHATKCPICRAPADYATAHFAPLPRPWWQRIPSWLQPAVFGAIAIGGIVAFRVLFMSAPVTMKLGVIGVAILGGAAPGLVFSLTRPLVRKLGALGDYLTGIVIMAAYVGAFAIMFSLLPGKPLIGNRADAMTFTAVVIGFGFFGAYSWRRNNRAPS